MKSFFATTNGSCGIQFFLKYQSPSFSNKRGGNRCFDVLCKVATSSTHNIKIAGPAGIGDVQGVLLQVSSIEGFFSETIFHETKRKWSFFHSNIVVYRDF